MILLLLAGFTQPLSSSQFSVRRQFRFKTWGEREKEHEFFGVYFRKRKILWQKVFWQNFSDFDEETVTMWEGICQHFGLISNLNQTILHERNMWLKLWVALALYGAVLPLNQGKNKSHFSCLKISRNLLYITWRNVIFDETKAWKLNVEKPVFCTAAGFYFALLCRNLAHNNEEPWIENLTMGNMTWFPKFRYRQRQELKVQVRNVNKTNRFLSTSLHNKSYKVATN